MLKNREIILGVSGGIAAYKSVELLREMTKKGANVHVVMTKNAQQFVTPLTFQTLSGNPVLCDMFRLLEDSKIGHMTLADIADLMVIAPATANILGKIANGIADDYPYHHGHGHQGAGALRALYEREYVAEQLRAK